MGVRQYRNMGCEHLVQILSSIFINKVKKENRLFSPYGSPQECDVPLNTRTLPDSKRMTKFPPENAANLTVASDCWR